MKKIALFALVGTLSLAMIPTVHAGTILSSGVWTNNNKMYMVMASPYTSWDAAKSDIGTGYRLATITSQEEQSYVESLLGGIEGQFMIGGYQAPDEIISDAGWNWDDSSEPWDWTNWAPGEPNDYYGPASEQYLAMWSRFNWQWNDEGNLHNITGYIVESTSNVVPEPSTLFLMGLGLIAFRITGWRNRS